MLAALEDLLDSWPGTLIVVSHDRYLVERITDQQYAVLNKTLRHLPGGIDEYLQLTAAANSEPKAHPAAAESAISAAKPAAQDAAGTAPTWTGGERHARHRARPSS